MLIGVPKEIKTHEYRVGLIPATVRELVTHGHRVIVERHAGDGIGMDDAAYQKAGASIVDTAAEIFANAEMVVKVKEPQPAECAMLHTDQVLFTYLHLAPDPEQTKALLNSGAVCIAYETVTSATGGLPLLAPMSEVAGRMSIQAGASCLEKAHGGLGVLLGGVPGVKPAKVVILGGGVVGSNAAFIAVGMGAEVVIIDRSIDVLRGLWRQFGASIETVYSTTDAIEQHVLSADLVIGGVLIPGAAAPKLVTKEHVQNMKAGAVIVDVAIDQGGCFATSHPTTHAEPTYLVNQVIHYCVANMPGAVPRTSTVALNNATLPHVLALADKGYRQALLDDVYLRQGLNIYQGKVTHHQVANALGHHYLDALTALA
ncbi:alanine dehydrogenase [Beggiatoa leptomitoformis]|uniref:Alanine dehydrogenase n=1 Tax=Beggiatoa leptomitoformis TaxID=288004 RepID=A0A2N9YI02_9GAMM|nr:alanine dehydrogenase [Beggiatoa leptomitoformis]ALG67611.1 alanine dehydrogenase [Beggiatoa leptomitoformis]AUI70158.1 alanine dehydrogenase [Beggiatoa leptomitoformis]